MRVPTSHPEVLRSRPDSRLLFSGFSWSLLLSFPPPALLLSTKSFRLSEWIFNSFFCVLIKPNGASMGIEKCIRDRRAKVSHLMEVLDAHSNLNELKPYSPGVFLPFFCSFFTSNRCNNDKRKTRCIFYLFLLGWRFYCFCLPTTLVCFLCAVCSRLQVSALVWAHARLCHYQCQSAIDAHVFVFFFLSTCSIHFIPHVHSCCSPDWYGASMRASEKSWTMQMHALRLTISKAYRILGSWNEHVRYFTFTRILQPKAIKRVGCSGEYRERVNGRPGERAFKKHRISSFSLLCKPKWKWSDFGA